MCLLLPRGHNRKGMQLCLCSICKLSGNLFIFDNYGSYSGYFSVTGLSLDLEDLIVEGLLLQVSLPEVQTLYSSLLDRTSSWNTNTDCDEHMQFTQGSNLPADQVQTHNKNCAKLCIITVSDLICYCFQDGVATSEKKSKRHMETEGLDAEHRAKNRKHSHKRQKMNKKNLQRRPTSTSPSPRSDFSQSDESDEEIAVCPAERCQQPEGDEVRKT